MAPSMRTVTALLLMLAVAGLATALPATAHRGGGRPSMGGNSTRGELTPEDILDRLMDLDMDELAERMAKANVTTMGELVEAILARMDDRGMGGPGRMGNGTRPDCNVTAEDIEDRLMQLDADKLAERMAKFDVTTMEELVEAILAAGPCDGRRGRNGDGMGRRGGDRNLLGRGNHMGNGTRPDRNITAADIEERLMELDADQLAEKMAKFNVTTMEELVEAILASGSRGRRGSRNGDGDGDGMRVRDSDRNLLGRGGNYTREEMIERLQDRLEDLDDSELEELMEKHDADTVEELIEAILAARGDRQRGGRPNRGGMGGGMPGDDTDVAPTRRFARRMAQ